MRVSVAPVNRKVTTMHKIPATLVSLVLFAATPALGADAEAILGGALGGGVGAAVGSEVGGREGAIAGGAIGAAVGTAVATGDGEHDRGHHRDYDDDPRVIYREEEQHHYHPGPPGHAKRGYKHRY